MKTTVLILSFALAALLSGCITKSQLDGKLPQISAEKATITISTIYGVGGKLDVKNLRYENGVKKADQYDVTQTSPFETVVITATNVSIPSPAAK